MTNEDVLRVKGFGCLRDKTTEDCFNVRVITRNGKITADEMNAISEAAILFGSGEVAFTTRQTVEIQRVKYENIDTLIDFLKKHSLETGGTGPKVRPIVSCKGTTCVFGLIDTFDLSLKIHNRFYKGYRNVKFPHKLKIAVGGCPNNCVKPDLNDIGIIGQLIPTVDTEKCRGCKVCGVEKSCPVGACKVENGKVVIDKSICNNCGRCKGKCPFNAFDNYVQGYKIYIGGRWGKKFNRGFELSKIFTDEGKCLDTVEKVMLLFKDKGIQGERFAQTIERITFEVAENLIYSDELLERKDEILSK
ncbi:MAG: 4Fe-4S binding protein [Clostridia bacterium]|nr:4Fe-4S binding protein [Clostridia bacterium]